MHVGGSSVAGGASPDALRCLPCSAAS